METPGMKIQFDTLDYQTDAVNAAVNIFNGQMIKTSNFFDQTMYRDQFHSGDQITLALRCRHEGSWPGRSIFDKWSCIRNS